MAERTGRWITVRKPFDYRWPSRAITAFAEADLGEHMVKGEVADFAVDNGYATEGKADGSEARSRKGGKRRVRSKPKAEETAPATTADSGSAETVDHEAVPDADRPADRPGVDHDAG